jgi:hypothetical protein
LLVAEAVAVAGAVAGAVTVTIAGCGGGGVFSDIVGVFSDCLDCVLPLFELLPAKSGASKL